MLVLFTMSIASSLRQPASAALQAMSDGTYLTTYRINQTGSYDLLGKIGAMDLVPSYTVQVETGDVRPERCLDVITGWSPGNDLSAGDSVSVNVTARDKGVQKRLHQLIVSIWQVTLTVAAVIRRKRTIK